MPRTTFFREKYMRQDLIDLIRIKMKRKGVTYDELGKHIGVTRRTISRYLDYDAKDGMNEMSYGALVKVFDFLQFDDSEILKVVKK